tara:strand:+ start:1023 stop:1214 length:192 start_codon:yes stop_codon:yes gene_type:complete
MTKNFEAACRPIKDVFLPVIIQREGGKIKFVTTINAQQSSRKAAIGYAKALIAGDIKGDFDYA